tara:strand:+ start:171 stop:386 length:216 start_codon:yes stop_codon:yes gene_type:complete
MPYKDLEERRSYLKAWLVNRRALSQEWYLAHRAERLEYGRVYYQANREKLLATQRKQYAAKKAKKELENKS